jgi:hypothetical protein
VQDFEGRVQKVSDNVVAKVLSQYDDLKGHEETVTAQISSEITLHLLEGLEKELNGVKIKNVNFKVYVYKKREEKKNGADLLGIFDIEIDGEKITKSFLAQAKVGEAYSSPTNEYVVKVQDSRLQGQVRNMLRQTSDAFVFIYSRNGVEVIPATAVKLANSNTITTEDIYHQKFGSFYKDFLRCFNGDVKLVAQYVRPENLPVLADEINTDQVILISVSAGHKRRTG